MNKKRVNVYLTQKTIDRADELARKLSYELGAELNRSNILELAFEVLRNQENLNDLVLKAMKSLEE